ncbi:MAG: aconitate hydratase, partial [Kribbellaceae bacterium]|nr:aconitate hydratase [Kribbellaceae bacterium]
SSPGNVVPVRDVAGTGIGQVVIGSSANPGLRDFAIAGAMVRGRQTSAAVSFDVNPTSRSILEDLTRMGTTLELVAAGARIHQAGCLGCIGMGQAPAGGTNSLRTMPRNFPGRSGSRDDAVYLCSPETAAASALSGVVVDPRDWAQEEEVPLPELDLLRQHTVNLAMLEPPSAEAVQLEKGPNIGSLPDFDGLPDHLEVQVALKVGDNVSTDEISPAGAAALPYRSNIAKLAEFTFRPVDPEYVDRACKLGDHAIVGGANYGQGSSREHAAITPRYLGLRLVVARSFARIHWQNLANFGVLACELVDDADYDRLDAGDTIVLDDLRERLRTSDALEAKAGDRTIHLRHRLSARQIDMLLAGGVIPLLRSQRDS